MKVVRGPSPKSNFTVLDNELLQDSRLSFRARGLLAYLLSMPDGWETDSTRIAAETSEGRDAVRAALRELEAAGYVRSRRVRGERGRIVTEATVGRKPAGRTGDGFSGPGGGDQSATPGQEPVNPQVAPETGFQAPVGAGLSTGSGKPAGRTGDGLPGVGGPGVGGPGAGFPGPSRKNPEKEPKKEAAAAAADIVVERAGVTEAEARRFVDKLVETRKIDNPVGYVRSIPPDELETRVAAAQAIPRPTPTPPRFADQPETRLLPPDPDRDRRGLSLVRAALARRTGEAP